MARYSSRRAKALKRAIDRWRASERIVRYENVEIVLHDLGGGMFNAEYIVHAEPRPGANYVLEYVVKTCKIPAYLMRHLERR